MSSLTITGKVVDIDDSALPGVVVFIIGENVETTISTVTDSHGHFELRDLPPPGQYLLSASKDGFLDWKKPVSVQPDNPFEVNITMYPE